MNELNGLDELIFYFPTQLFNNQGELLMKNDSEVAMNGNGGRVFATG